MSCEKEIRDKHKNLCFFWGHPRQHQNFLHLWIFPIVIVEQTMQKGRNYFSHSMSLTLNNDPSCRKKRNRLKSCLTKDTNNNRAISHTKNVLNMFTVTWHKCHVAVFFYLRRLVGKLFLLLCGNTSNFIFVSRDNVYWSDQSWYWIMMIMSV